MEDNKYYVYELIDPINNEPFYVGKGKNDRLNDHFKKYYADNKETKNRIKYILENNKIPISKILHKDLNEYCALELEKYYIDEYKQKYTLTNYSGIKQKYPIHSKFIINKINVPISIGWLNEDLNKEMLCKAYNTTIDKIYEAIEIYKIKNKEKLDIDKIKIFYIDKNYTQKQICEMFNIGRKTFTKLIIKYNLYKRFRPILDIKELQRIYVDENYSKKHTCEYFNISNEQLRLYLEEFNIKKVNPSKHRIKIERKTLDPIIFKKLYLDEKHSRQYIMNYFNVNSTVIRNTIEKYNLQRI